MYKDDISLMYLVDWEYEYELHIQVTKFVTKIFQLIN